MSRPTLHRLPAVRALPCGSALTSPASQAAVPPSWGGGGGCRTFRTGGSPQPASLREELSCGLCPATPRGRCGKRSQQTNVICGGPDLTFSPDRAPLHPLILCTNPALLSD